MFGNGDTSDQSGQIDFQNQATYDVTSSEIPGIEKAYIMTYIDQLTRKDR